MKNTTAKNRLTKISIINDTVKNLVSAIVNGDACPGVSYSINKMRPSIQFFSCNDQYSLYELVLESLSKIGLKTKATKNSNGFDIKIINIEYEN